MKLKESIIQILSDKKARKEGLHVKHIARHIHNSNNTLFSDGSDDFETLKKRVNRILANDVKKKKNRRFAKVKNLKTTKFKRGVYKLKH